MQDVARSSLGEVLKNRPLPDLFRNDPSQCNNLEKHQKFPTFLRKYQMAAQGLKTSSGTQAFVDYEPNLTASLKLREDSKIRKSFYGVGIDTEQLNSIF